ncbi:MAG: ABC-type transport auxiliary lipoprotein family protein [Janthinobacterium lividum]
MSSRLVLSVVPLALALLLGGCAAPKPPAQDRLVQYDLGPADVATSPDVPSLEASSNAPSDASPDTSPNASLNTLPNASPNASPNLSPSSPGAVPLPLLKIVAVTAPTALDSDRMIYRLVYADPRQARRYAGSRWTATPAQLLTERLRNVLARQARILDGGDPERGAPLLKVVLLDFSQRFDAPGAGQGVVTVRASLLRDGHLLAQRDFAAAVPGATADAAGGATAMAAAADAVVRDIGVWLGAWTQAGGTGNAQSETPSPRRQ